MVVFLYLDTEMENFQSDTSESTFIWDMSNMELPQASCIALSSINVQFIKNGPRFKVSTNLIQPDFLNPDSILISLPPPRTREISLFLPAPQTWRIDTTSPRVINLKFHSANIDIIRFASFTFVIS